MSTIDTARLGEVATSKFDAGLETLCSYVEIPCVSAAFDPTWEATGAIDEAAELLVSFAFDVLGESVSATRLTLPGRCPVVVLELDATEPALSGHTTLLYGHFDKQPPLGEWREGLSAFKAVREDGRLYGRGSADDGYAAFAILGALKSLHELGLSHGRVVVLLESGEESGSPDLEAYLDHLEAVIGSPRLVICLDSGGASYDRLWLTSSLRGVVAGTLVVRVLEEAIHSGLGGGIVPSSFRVARVLLSRLEDEQSGEILLEALRATPPGSRLAEIESLAQELGEKAAEGFPAVDGLVLQGGGPAERIRRGTWESALEVIGASGLPAPVDAGNVIRPETALRLSVRLPPTCDVDVAATALEEALLKDPPSGAKVSFVVDQRGAGWDAPALSTGLFELLESCSTAYFGKPPSFSGTGGSIPFMASLGARYQDAEFVATGVLGPGSNAHGPNESLDLRAARAMTATIAHLLAAAPGEQD